MKWMTNWKTFALGAAASTLIACGPPVDDEDKNNSEPQPVDHQTTESSLEENTRDMSRRISDSIRFVEDSKFVLDSIDMFDAEPRCAEPGGGMTPCENNDTEPEIDTDTSQYTDDIITELKKAIFNEDNVVAESETAVTYKVDPQYMCDYDGQTCMVDSNGNETCKDYSETQDYKDCVANTKAMKYRVKVSSPSKGDLNFELQVGPGHTPGSIELHKDHIAATARLGDIKKSIKHSDTVYGTDTAGEIPSTF